MGSKSKLKITQIDFSEAQNLKPGTSKWVATCKEVQQALEEIGCFELIYNQAPAELHDAVFATAEQLFDLPLEVKTQFTSDKPYFDYYGQYKTIPLYESLGVDDPTSFEGTQSFTKLMWPRGNDHFRESAQAFSQVLVELDKMVMRMVCESYGIKDYYEHYVREVNYLLRYFKYRKSEANETMIGIPSHTDKSMFSIIHQHQISGLQVRASNGPWINVDPNPYSFIVMSGDPLLAWSNDRIPACDHQVIMKEKKTRYSVGLFSMMSGMVETPVEMVDEDHPLAYKPFDHFGFLRFHATAEGKRAPSAIKAYCGLQYSHQFRV